MSQDVSGASPGSSSSRSVFELGSVAGFSMAAVSPDPALAAAAAVIGLLLLVRALFGGRAVGVTWSHRWAGLAALGILFLSRVSTVGPFPESFDRIRPVWIVMLVASLVIAVVLGHRRKPRLFSIGLGLAAVTALTVGMTVAEWNSPAGTDVYLIHEDAGSALLDGDNPYGSAVRVPSGSPHVPPDTVVEGYTYPPVVLTTYAAAAALADPRIISLVVWLAILVWVGVLADTSDPSSNAVFGIFLLLAATPVWPVIWFASWTEPLSLGLILLAVLLWRPRPVLSAVFLGLALASKQYFIFLAPLVLLHRDGRRMQRAVVAFGTAGLTMLPALVVDAPAFVSATIGNLADIGLRVDSQSLPSALARWGVDLNLPQWAWVVLGLTFAAVVGRGSRKPSDFVIYAALILGFAFLIGQAFPNYWFLVAGLVSSGVLLASGSATHRATSAHSSFVT